MYFNGLRPYDEDQISAIKASVDVLTLSATPIPRTLHMAIAGFRDASLVGPGRKCSKCQMMDFNSIIEGL